MNKRFLVAAAVLALVLPVLHADIGENFARGGIGLSGSVSFYNNFYRIADPADESNYWSLDVSPELDYYVADRTSLWLAPWLVYESMKNNASNIYKSLGLGFNLGGSYAFFPDPASQKGMVFSLGAAVGLSFFPGVADLIAGVETPDDSMETDLQLLLLPRLYFFLNDRMAPFIGLTPRLIYVLSEKDTSGAKVDLTSQERLYARLTATVGISWFIPSRNASLSAPRRVR